MKQDIYKMIGAFLLLLICTTLAMVLFFANNLKKELDLCRNENAILQSQIIINKKNAIHKDTPTIDSAIIILQW